MVPVLDLWLPILLGAVAAFFVSSLIHMVLPIHAGDWKKLPDEDRTLEQLRAAGIPPGSYMFPNAASPKDMGTPEMQAKFERGPVGYLTLMPPGGCRMGRSLVQWFVLCIAVAAGAGYVAGIGLPAGAPALDVFRLTSTFALFAHGTAAMTDAIWKGASWGVAAKFAFDGLLYALATGAMFAWLWPAGAV